MIKKNNNFRVLSVINENWKGFLIFFSSILNEGLSESQMLAQFNPFQLHLAPCIGFYELINCIWWQDLQLDPTHAINIQ